MKRRALLVGAAGLAGAGAWHTGALERVASPSATDSGADVTDTAAVNAAFLERFNAMRDERGLDTVTESDTLVDMATEHAANMAEHDYVGHEQPDGTTIEDRYRERGLLPECRLPDGDGRYYPGAENAAGAAVGRFTTPGSGETFRVDDAESLTAFLIDSWMGSPPHRRVMILPAVETIGLGVARSGDDLYAALELC
jgi:uncharacterized protein YkwD